jgi:iduronate 2-sulfatase
MYAVTLRSRVFRYIQWQKDLAEGEILFRELYDHRSDPDETNNLATSEPKVIKHFEKMLREHLD